MRTYFFVSFIACSVAILIGCNRSSESTAETSPTEDLVELTSVEFANSKCPIIGGKPKSDLIAQYNGHTIGFCCEGCPEKWAALSEPEQADKFATAIEDVEP